MSTVSEAIQGLLLAMAERVDAKASFDPYNWDYFGQRYEDAVEQAEEEFFKALNAHIDDRIEAATGARP